MPARLACDCVQLAKPPWNQPQVTPFAFSRSPMFLLWGSTDVELSRVSHLSPVGCGSPMTVPLAAGTALPSAENPWVCPEMRLSAPGLDGPNVVLNELSFIAKLCA